MFGRQTYVRLPGTRDVILAAGDLANWVPRNADDWRDLRLVPEDLEFDRLRFWGQSRTVELAKGGDGAWRMELPVDSAADQMVIRQLIQRMQLARIVQVAAAAGEGEPAATVRLARGRRHGHRVGVPQTGRRRADCVGETFRARHGGDPGRRSADPAATAARSVPRARGFSAATPRGHLRHRGHDQQIHRRQKTGRCLAGDRAEAVSRRRDARQRHAYQPSQCADCRLHKRQCRRR